MTTVYIALVLLAIGLGVLVWLPLAGPDQSRALALGNLRRGLDKSEDDGGREAQGSLGFGRFIDNPQRRGKLQTLLAKAGYPGGWTVDQVLSIKVLGTVVSASLMFVMWLTGRQPVLFAMIFVVGALVYFLPNILLHNTAIKRREQVDLELADTLDQMSIAVQAGLGFDAAMLRVARNGKGVLSQELIRTMQDIRVGQSRRNAYENLSERTGSVPLRRFTRTVIQAEAYGIPLADVLSAQADEMRIARKQNAERKAMEIPVKVTFPLIVCILPVIFIVVVGPAVISIMENLGALS